MTVLILYAPPYTEDTGGIIVMHYLCHTLNERFPDLVQAHLSPFFRHQRVTTNPTWNTPIFHGRLSKDTIVLYPEIVTNNPLSHEGPIVRWMLSFCKIDWDNEDYIFYYSSKGNDHYRQGEEWQLFLVYTPPIERLPNHGKGSCFFVGKGRSFPRNKEMERKSQNISFRSIAELLSVLRKHEVFYSYDPYSYISNLAVFCGCRSIVVPPPGLSKDEWFRLRGPYGYKGVAYGEDDLDRAVREVEEGEPWTYLEQMEKGAMRTVERFARFCFSFSVSHSSIRFHRLPEIDIDPSAIRKQWETPSMREWTDRCLSRISSHYPDWHAVLTTSATHALETIAILMDIRNDDEVIVPSFTFSSTANAFVSHGATIVMADSRKDHPSVDIGDMTRKIGSRTRAVVMVHYGGHVEENSIDLPEGVLRIDDASHCIGEDLSSTRADFCVFSFHTTKNISTGGEGGLLLYRNEAYRDRICAILDKGTNRETDPVYEWVSKGSAFRMTELSCLFLCPQLDVLTEITQKRRNILRQYQEGLRGISGIVVPEHSGCHTCFFSTPDARDVVRFLSEHGVEARQHYTPLHSSLFYQTSYPSGKECPNAERWAETIVRLPLHTFLTGSDVDRIVGLIHRYYGRPERESRTR